METRSKNGRQPVKASRNSMMMAPEEQKRFNHLKTRSHHFRIALENKRFTDVKIVLNNTSTFEVNSFLLSSLSEPFASLLEGGFRESIGDEKFARINDPYITSKAFNQLINFAYLQETSIGIENAVEVYYLCEVYGVDELKDMALLPMLAKSTHPLALLDQAVECSMEVPIDEALAKINFTNGHIIATSEEFKKLQPRTIEKMLSSPSFHGLEYVIINAVLEWVQKYPKSKQKKMFKKFKPYFRLGLLSQSYIENVIFKEEAIKSILTQNDIKFLKKSVEERHEIQKEINDLSGIKSLVNLPTHLRASARGMHCLTPKLRWKDEGFNNITNILRDEGKVAHIDHYGFLARTESAIPARRLSYVEVSIENIEMYVAKNDRNCFENQTRFGIFDAATDLRDSANLSQHQHSIVCLNLYSSSVWNGDDNHSLGYSTTNLDKHHIIGMFIDTMVGRFQLVIMPRKILKNPYSGFLSKIFTSVWFNAPRLAGAEVIMFINVYGKARCTIRLVGDELVPLVRQILDKSLRLLVSKSLPPSQGLLPIKSATTQVRRPSPLPLGSISPSRSVGDLKVSTAPSDSSMQTPSHVSNSPGSDDNDYRDTANIARSKNDALETKNVSKTAAKSKKSQSSLGEEGSGTWTSDDTPEESLEEIHFHSLREKLGFPSKSRNISDDEEWQEKSQHTKQKRSTIRDVGPSVDFFSQRDPDLSIELLTDDAPKKKKQKPTPQTHDEYTKRNKELMKRKLDRAQKFQKSKDQHGTPPSSDDDDEKAEKSYRKSNFSYKPEDFPKLVSNTQSVASESLTIDDEHLVKKENKSSKTLHREKVQSEKWRKPKKVITNPVSAPSGKRKSKTKVQNVNAPLNRDKLRSKPKDRSSTLHSKVSNRNIVQTRKEVNLTKVSKLSHGQQTSQKVPQQAQNSSGTYVTSYQPNFTATTWGSQIQYVNHMNHPQSYVNSSPHHPQRLYHKTTASSEDLEKKMTNWVKTNLQLFWPTPVEENEICTLHQAQLNGNEIHSYISVSKTQSISRSKRQNDTKWKEQSSQQGVVPSEEVVIPVDIGDLNSSPQMSYPMYVPFSNSYQIGNHSMPSQSIPYINSSAGVQNTVLGQSNYPMINSWINMTSPYQVANSQLLQAYYPVRNMPLQMSVFQNGQPTVVNRQMMPINSSMIQTQQSRMPTTSRQAIQNRPSDRSKDFTPSNSSYQKNSLKANDEFSTPPRGIKTKKNIQHFFKQLKDFEKISSLSKFHTRQRSVSENKPMTSRPSDASYSRVKGEIQRTSPMSSQTKLVCNKEPTRMTKTGENCAYKRNAQRPILAKPSAEPSMQDPRSSSWADMLKGNKAEVDSARRLEVDSSFSQTGGENEESQPQQMTSPSFPTLQRRLRN